MFAAALLLCAGFLAAQATSQNFYDQDPAALQYGLPGLPPSSRRVVSGVLCANSAAFALTAGLEIGYQKLTGLIPTKLSEQEIVDCFYSGCFDAELDHLAKWLEVQGRLAPADKYTPFLGGWDAENSICRSAQAPNALQVGLGELQSIEAAEIDEWLEKSGFVFAKMSLNHEKCPGYYKRKSEVFGTNFMEKYQDKNDDGLIDGYVTWLTGENGHVVTGVSTIFSDAHVLIVGTYKDTDGTEYYIVRESRGDVWMRRGHFLMPRGNNHCGIEHNLQVAEISLIDNKVGHDAVTGCPDHSPKWCAETMTCTKVDQDCVANETPDVTGYDPETSAPANKAKVWDFSGRPECQDRPGFELTCADIAQTWGNCKSEKIQKMCAGTCLVCAKESPEYKCEDFENTEGECAKYTRFCKVDGVVTMCAKTCNLHPSDCGTLEDNINLLAGVGKPSKGMCYPPVVENGRVLNSGMLQAGDNLEIECDAGFELVGEQTHCVLQDMYGPDSRITQACIQMGGEDWNGNGKNYNGNRAETLQFSLCANWQTVAATGLFNFRRADLNFVKAAVKKGSSYNHNYCRNPDGVAATPWCFTSEINLEMYKKLTVTYQNGEAPEDGMLSVNLAEIMYCDGLPACGGDFCANSENDAVFGPFCFAEHPKNDCSLDSVSGEWMQGFCTNYCCRLASECEETPVIESFGGDDFGFDDFGGDDFGGDDFGGEEDFGDFGDDDGFGDFGDDDGFGDFGGDDDFGDFGGDDDFGDFGDFGSDDGFGDFGGEEDFGDSGFDDFGGDDFGGDDFGGDDFGGDDFGGDDFGGDDFGGDDFGGDDFGGDDFGGDDFGGDDFGGDDFGGDDFGGDDFGGNDFGGDDFGGNDFGGDDFGGDDFGGDDFGGDDFGGDDFGGDDFGGDDFGGDDFGGDDFGADDFGGDDFGGDDFGGDDFGGDDFGGDDFGGDDFGGDDFGGDFSGGFGDDFGGGFDF